MNCRQLDTGGHDWTIYLMSHPLGVRRFGPYPCVRGSAWGSVAAPARLPCFLVLILDFFPASSLDDRQRGTDDVLAEFEHGRLLLASRVVVRQRQKVLPLLREQRQR